MTKKPTIDEEDAELFRKSMRNVTPIKQKDRVILKEKLKRLPRTGKASLREETQEEKQIVLEEESTEVVSGDESLHFSRSGLQTRYLRKLKRGQIPCEAFIDLHRMTVAEAEIAVANFISSTQESGLRCVRIIHGKGYRAKTEKPILKNKVNSWLRAHPAVLAFCSAQPKDGGAGAVYVLLKSS